MGTGGKVKMEEGTGGGTHVGFKAPDTEVVDELLWTLPSTDGAAGQMMGTDGSKNIIWVTNLDSSLQAAISSEYSSRLVADSSLYAAIGDEATARDEMDSSLYAAIGDEAAVRDEMDSSLQASLNLEYSSRVEADSTLQSNIDSPPITFVSSATNAAFGQTLGCDSSFAAFTITAPVTSPASVGKRFRVMDVKGMASTNNITIGRNGSNIGGTASDFIIDVNWADITFVYYDAIVGWAPVR